ncbi:MAG TPA: LptF/LptG family permease [Gemmatimonadaceae bacterium]|nr:LptF/LptG family permease [Gemmatimonadaceae bacterium]
MRILTRYTLREHFGPLVFSLAALTSVLLLNQIAKQFGQLVGKGLPWSVIGEFFALTIPFIIAMTLPMAVLVSVLYAFSRLAAENEITALRASGVSLRRLLGPVFWGGLAMAAIMLFFNDQILPRTNHRLRTLQTDIARKKPTFALREQVINEIAQGRLFLRAGHIDEGSNRMREITIYDLSDPLQRRTIYADSGSMEMTQDRRDLQMTLHDGYSQTVSNDKPGELQRLFFVTDLVRVRGVGNQLERTGEDAFKSDREMTICEMQEMVDEASQEMAIARAQLRNALGEAARRAATGERRINKIPPDEVGLSAGGLYCRGLAAAGLAARKLPPPDERGRTTNVAPSMGLPIDPTTGTPAIPHDASSAVTQIEIWRTRILDAKQQIYRYGTEIHKKFALAAACVVFVLLGAPIALRFPRGGVGLVIGVSLGVFALYYVGLIGGETLADKLILAPVWAMWIANLIFAAVALVFLVRVQKSGATARGGDASELWDTIRSWSARVLRRVGIHAERRRRTA